jgi:hypothetical protein
VRAGLLCNECIMTALAREGVPARDLWRRVAQARDDRILPRTSTRPSVRRGKTWRGPTSGRSARRTRRGVSNALFLGRNRGTGWKPSPSGGVFRGPRGPGPGWGRGADRGVVRADAARGRSHPRRTEPGGDGGGEARGTRAGPPAGPKDAGGLVAPPLAGGAPCRGARGRGGISPRVLFVVRGTGLLRWR